MDRDVGAGGCVGAFDLDGAALGAVFFSTFPVFEGEVFVFDAVAIVYIFAAPVAVDVEGVCVAVA